MEELSAAATPQLLPARQQRDAAVKQIIADFDCFARSGSRADAALARAAETLRIYALATQRMGLQVSQKKRLQAALSATYPVLYLSAADDAGRREVVLVANSLLTLIWIWADDDPRWRRCTPAAEDACDLVLAFELELLRSVVLEACVARKTATKAERAKIFDNMLSSAIGRTELPGEVQ